MAKENLLPAELTNVTSRDLASSMAFNIAVYVFASIALLVPRTMRREVDYDICNSVETPLQVMGIAILISAFIGFMSLHYLIIAGVSVYCSVEEKASAMELHQMLDKAQFHVCKHIIIVGIFVCLSLPVGAWYVISLLAATGIFFIRFPIQLGGCNDVDELQQEKDVSGNDVSDKKMYSV